MINLTIKDCKKQLTFLTTMIFCKRINYFWKKIQKNFKLLRSLKNKKKIRLKDIKDKILLDVQILQSKQLL